MKKTALEHAAEDERSGDLGSARRRLMSYVSTQGYDEGIVEQIARICIRMHDLREAGRWYFLCDSKDAEAAEAIERFSASCNGNLRQILSQLPLGGTGTAKFPAAVQARFGGLRLLARGPREARVSKTEQRLTAVGCMLGLVVVASLLIIGAIAVVRFFLK
jgi:hypothetical protein